MRPKGVSEKIKSVLSKFRRRDNTLKSIFIFMNEWMFQTYKIFWNLKNLSYWRWLLDDSKSLFNESKKDLFFWSLKIYFGFDIGVYF